MIILSRMLKLAQDGRELDVPIRIHLPIDKKGHWECEYEIGWPGAGKRSKAGGIDSVQALLIAMQKNRHRPVRKRCASLGKFEVGARGWQIRISSSLGSSRPLRRR